MTAATSAVSKAGGRPFAYLLDAAANRPFVHRTSPSVRSRTYKSWMVFYPSGRSEFAGVHANHGVSQSAQCDVNASLEGTHIERYI